MSIEIENLTDAIVTLTEKLHAFHIQIHDLNSTLQALSRRVGDLSQSEPWNE